MEARKGQMSSDREATRAKLIDATARVALEHGFRAMTVGHILEAAPTSRRTFYQYFRSKEDAFLALYESVVADLLAAVSGRVDATPDPTLKLYAGLDAYLDYQREGGELVTLMQAEAANPASLLSPRREQALDELVALVDREVKQTMSVSIDPLVYRSLYLGLEGLVIHYRDQGSFTEAEQDRVAGVIKPLFLATLISNAHMPEPPTT